MLTFGIQVILVIILISGVIAYIGDYIGRKVGRSRLTFFSLRPRYTAIVFTIISGIFIAIFTLTTLVIISQDARTALFGLENLRKNISLTKKDLNSARQELDKRTSELDKIKNKLIKAKTDISQFEALKKSLKQEIETAQEGALIYRAGEVILITKINGNQREEQIREVLDEIVVAANSYLKKISFRKKGVNVVVSKYASTLNYLVEHEGEFILSVIVDKNVIIGENVPIHFEIVANHLVFKSGEKIASAAVDGRNKQAQIEQQLKAVLAKAHIAAREVGIIPDVNGSIGKIPYSKMYKMTEQIKAFGSLVNVMVVAEKDIYTIGPLEVEFKL